MYEGVIHGVLPQPWSLNNSPSSVQLTSKGDMNTMSTGADMRGGSLHACEYMENIGSHNIINEIAEDFFIDDLSEFSNEDIAAPIKTAMIGLPSLMHHHQQHSYENTSASPSKDPSSAIKSDCTTAHTSTSGNSVLLHADSPATALPDYKSSLLIEMDSSLPLPCQDETGFEWLTAFGEDSLLYGASNFGMDSFLLSNTEPFGGYDGLIKHGGYEDDSKVKVGHTMNGDNTNDEQGGAGGGPFDQNGINEFDAMMFMPHSTGSRSARTKRARSAGWSSSSILCDNWDNNSPTNSLNSTSQITPNPPYSSPPTFMHKQEENDAQHGYTTHQHNVELISSSLGAPNRDKSFSKAAKFCSNEEALNGWAKEEENTREESVISNYGGLQPRRCSHCLSQKTPQWRAGPEGPKTLCNACGVRYKSGRLFDEYRPAKSPTFLSYKHSNSHKKVMEMRRRKTLQYYGNHHRHHHHHHQAAHQTRAPPPPSLKCAEVDPHLGNKLKIKLNPSTVEPHSQFSDVTLISTSRTALESPSSFLY